jgi:hypothetical protein
MMSYVKYSADLMRGMGDALVVVGSVLNILALRDRPNDYKGLTWRARFVAENRRHPRLRGAAMACLAVAVLLLIGYAITLFG